MKLSSKILALFKAIPAMLFPFATWKGVASTQIDLYKRWQGKISEQEILNRLIISRLNATWGKEKELASKSYGYLLDKNDKTLEEVIYAIINYENIESPDSKKRIEKNDLKKEEIDIFKEDVMHYIKNAVEKMNK